MDRGNRNRNKEMRGACAATNPPPGWWGWDSCPRVVRGLSRGCPGGCLWVVQGLSVGCLAGCPAGCPGSCPGGLSEGLSAAVAAADADAGSADGIKMTAWQPIWPGRANLSMINVWRRANAPAPCKENRKNACAHAMKQEKGTESGNI